LKRLVPLRTGDQGVAAVELALVLPVFLALIFAAIDFALAFREQIMLRNAASNAAAYAAVQPCDLTGTTGITYRASSELQSVSVLAPSNVSVAESFSDATGTELPSTACTTAYSATITVNAQYNLLTGGFLGIFGVPLHLPVSGSETVRIDR
jgi:Flp pilus assembly protein TadG